MPKTPKCVCRKTYFGEKHIYQRFKWQDVIKEKHELFVFRSHADSKRPYCVSWLIWLRCKTRTLCFDKHACTQKRYMCVGTKKVWRYTTNECHVKNVLIEKHESCVCTNTLSRKMTRFGFWQTRGNPKTWIVCLDKYTCTENS